MSVLEESDVLRRPYGSYADPALPVGIWVARAQVTGNATGGQAVIQVNFALSTQLRTEEAFSLEQITTATDGAGGRNAMLLTHNMDRDLSGVGLANAAQRWSFNQRNLTVGGSAISALEALGFRGLFFGRQHEANTATGFSVIWDNTDGFTNSVRVQGYVWGPRAVSTPSGPQRPLQGLYAI